MIVAGPEGLRKNQYRKFNIKSADLTPGDDFGMMREVLTRRFRRLMSEAPRRGGTTSRGRIRGSCDADGARTPTMPPPADAEMDPAASQVDGKDDASTAGRTSS